MKKIDIKSGMKFNRLTIIKEVEHIRIPCGQYIRLVECVCDCGKIKVFKLNHVRNNVTTSCGCYRDEIITRHGLYNDPAYDVLAGMKSRCKKTGNRKTDMCYFDKGITICDEWINNTLSFVEWAYNNGYKKGLHIDRIDNDKGYYPENCRFVSAFINLNNRRNTTYVDYKGERKSLSVLLHEMGILDKRDSIIHRLNKGLSFEDSLNDKIKESNRNMKRDAYNDNISDKLSILIKSGKSLNTSARELGLYYRKAYKIKNLYPEKF